MAKRAAIFIARSPFQRNARMAGWPRLWTMIAESKTYQQF